MPPTTAKANGLLIGVAATLLAVLLAGNPAWQVATRENHHIDLWIYSSGSWLALHGQTPYDVTAIHARVAERWPDDELLASNSGFFLPPQALLVYLPWAVLPWETAKPVWCVVHLALAVAAAWGMRTLGGTHTPGWFPAAAVLAVLVNPHTLFGLFLGQSTVMLLGCVVLGEAAERKGWRRLGCLLWAVAFVKPHLAIALLPLAWWLGGWRRAAELVAWVAALNVLAGGVFFGRPQFVLDYVWYVQQGHQTVEFNRVAGALLTSWNRVAAAAGGPAVELGVGGTLAGYAVLFAASVLRVKWRKEPPTREWAFALAGCGAVCCCQVHSYELPLLLLGLPYLVGLFGTHRLAALLLTVPVAVVVLPGWDIIAYHEAVDRLFGPDVWVLKGHTSLGVLLLTAGVMATGPGGWRWRRHRPS